MGLDLAVQHYRFHEVLHHLTKELSYTEEILLTKRELGLGDYVNCFFSILIVPDGNLPINVDVLAYLIDEASYSDRKSFIFVISFNPNAITYKEENSCFLCIHAIIAHELCHFIRYYEILLAYNNHRSDHYHEFKKEISRGLDLLVSQFDSHAQTSADEHTLHKDDDLESVPAINARIIIYFLSFKQDHYVRWGESSTGYQALFLKLFLPSMKKFS